MSFLGARSSTEFSVARLYSGELLKGTRCRIERILRHSPQVPLLSWILSHLLVESTINIDPIRKEICLPPLFEQRQSDFGRSVSALLEWLQPHLLSSRLRMIKTIHSPHPSDTAIAIIDPFVGTAAELLYKDVANVKVLFDFDTRSNSFYYRFE